MLNIAQSLRKWGIVHNLKIKNATDNWNNRQFGKFVYIRDV